MKNKKEKPTKETLIQAYLIENKTAKEIAKEVSLSEATIRRLFKAYNIQKDNTARCTCISKTKRAKTPTEIKAIAEKAKQTFIQKYRAESPMKLQRFKNKLKRSYLKKYGVDNPAKVPEIKEKIARTNLQRYGTENPFASEEIKNKIIKTNLARYGVTNPTQCADIRSKAAKKYKYNGINFDSSWELAFYIYHIDKGDNIQRELTSFVYEYKGKQHKYFVDFTINNINYEVKSDYLFRYMTTHEDSIEYAKYKCMLHHNVIILQATDLKECLNYVQKTYGYDFLQTCRDK